MSPELRAYPGALKANSSMQTFCGQRPRFSLNLEEIQPSAQRGRSRRMTARQKARKRHKGCGKICQFIYTSRQSLYCRHYNCPPKPWASFANTIAGHFPSLLYITYIFLSEIGTHATKLLLRCQESKSRFIWAPSYISLSSRVGWFGGWFFGFFFICVISLGTF